MRELNVSEMHLIAGGNDSAGQAAAAGIGGALGGSAGKLVGSSVGGYIGKGIGKGDRLSEKGTDLFFLL